MRRKTGDNCILLVAAHLIFCTTDDNWTVESSIQMEMERLAGSITQILGLNVSTCQDTVWRGRGRNHTKVFPWEETLQSSANFLLHFYSISFFSYYQWVRLDGKPGGDRRRKVWHVLTEHMCSCLKIVGSTNTGLLLLMRSSWCHAPELWECVQMWDVTHIPVV